MNLLAVGTRVRISAQGRHKYYDYRGNPHKAVGTVTAVHCEDNEEDFLGYFPYKVLWDNGYNNSYQLGEIESVISDVPLTRKDFQEMV